MTSLAPVASGQKNSHTETSKLNGVFCSTASAGPIPKASCIQRIRFTTPACSFIAPFGRPVDPDV